MPFIFVASFYFLMPLSFAQQLPGDHSISSYFDRLPAVDRSVEDAYAAYYPKGKITPCAKYQAAINSEINALADRSEHQSRLLSMIAGRYDEEAARIDFTKIKINKDKELAAAAANANASSFSALEDFWGTVTDRLSVALARYKGLTLAGKELEIYQQELPKLIDTVKKEFLVLDKLMDEKGYNKILAEAKSTNPYYIQILETRGIMLDRLLKLVQQIDAVQASVALQVESCKKDPELSK